MRSRATLMIAALAAAMAGGSSAQAQGARWIRTLGSAAADHFYTVAGCPDGSLIAGGFSDVLSPASDAWLIKVGPDGSVLDEAVLGGNGSEWIDGLACLPAGDVIVAGYTSASDLGASGQWMLSLNASLSIDWQRALRSALTPRAFDRSPSGTFVVGGSCRPTGARWNQAWLGELASDGTLLWDRVLTSPGVSEVRAIAAAPDGGLVAAIEREEALGSTTDVWIVRLSPAQDVSWQVRIGRATDSESCSDLVATADGGALVAATSIREPSGSSGLDAWLVRLDGTGSVQWQSAYGERDSDETANAVLPRPEGGFIVAGRREWPSTRKGPLLFAIDDAGVVSWARAVDPDPDFTVYVQGMTRTADGDIALIAWTQRGGSHDAWLLKLGPDGRIPGCGLITDVALPSRDPAVNASLTTETAAAYGATSLPTTASPRHATVLTSTDCDGVAPPPREVSPPASSQPLLFTDRTTLQWEDAASVGAEWFNAYRDDLTVLRGGSHGACWLADVATNVATDPDLPGVGHCFIYLVTGENAAGEGVMGANSLGATRANTAPCP